MPSPWNDTTDRQLLLIIIKLTAPQLPNWKEVADAMGPGFTAESTRQHFQKIRKTVDAAVTNGDTPATPKTPKSASKAKKPASSKKGSAKKRKIEETEDDEEPQNGEEEVIKEESVENDASD